MGLGLSARGCALFLLVPVAAACGDDVSENLPDGDFTSTGEDTFPPVTTTGQPTSNSGDPTTESTTETTESTTDGTTMGSDTGTTVEVTATESSTTGDPSTSSTGDPSASSTGSTTDATDGSTGSSTGTMGACGDDNIDDAEVCFDAGVSYAIGGTDPADAVAGDFDGDGNLDIATANPTSDNVSVLLGAGDGTLGNATEFGVGDAPARIQAGNLDDDGNDDLVTVNTVGNDISVLIADGSGGFAAAVAYDVGTGPVDVALGDLTEDGIDDVAVANPGSSNYHTLSNDGSGTLTVLGPWDADGISPGAIIIGDVALVGGQDVWFGGGGAYGASPGQGDGTINDGVLVGGNAGTDLLRGSVGDVDDDGFVDVVTTDGTEARFFLNGGRNNAMYTSMALTIGAAATEAVFADVTGEGDVDIIVSNAGDGTVSIFVGDGTGTFDMAATETLDCGNAPSGLAIADLDEDNVSDITCANGPDDEVTVLLSNP